MFRSFSNNGRKERGDILMESLIGIVLMSIIGLGISYAAARASTAQRSMKLQNSTVGQMRNLLALHGKTMCSNASLAVIRLPIQAGDIPLDVTCTSAAAVNIGGLTITGGGALGTVVLTTRTADNALFGGVIRVGDDT